MDFSSVCRAVGRKLAGCVRVGRHEYRHILGGDGATVFVGDGKRNVVVLVIPLVPFRDEGLTSLDPYAPLIPGVVQPNRAVFCFSHTILTLASPSSSATWAHPLGILATPRYSLSIFTIFLIWVVIFFVGVVCFIVGNDVRSERHALRLPSCSGNGFLRNCLMDLASMFLQNKVELVVVFVVMVFGWEVG